MSCDYFHMLKSLSETDGKKFLKSLSEKDLEDLKIILKFHINTIKNEQLEKALKDILKEENHPVCDYDLTHRYCDKCKKSISLHLCRC